MMYFQLILTLLFILFTHQTNPVPLLPSKFTESFIYYDSYTGNTMTGKLWFDDKIQTVRADFNKSDICDLFLQKGTTCRTVMVVNKIHFMSPEQNLCCWKQIPITVRKDIFAKYDFKGEKQIDSQPYFFWYGKHEPAYADIEYISDESSILKPRSVRAIMGIDQFYHKLDFLMNSYGQFFDSNAVFLIPNYCKTECRQ